MVPVYVPATAAAGIATLSPGFQEPLVMCPFPALELKAVMGVQSGCAAAAVDWPGASVAVPLEAVEGPDQ